MMKIDVYVLCYNELKLAPFVVQYWKRYANKVYVYDNGSTDGTIEYLQQFPELIDIIHFDSDGVDDIKYIEIKNNVWKKSRGVADYVVVGDFDECVYFSNVDDLCEYKKEHISLIKPVWHNCISNNFPVYDDDVLVHNSLRCAGGGAKLMIFDPDEINEINYKPGCHCCNPVGNVKMIESDNVHVFHLLDLGLEYVLNKIHQRRQRLSFGNIINGYGVHYLYDDEKIIKNFNDDMNESCAISVD